MRAKTLEAVTTKLAESISDDGWVDPSEVEEIETLADAHIAQSDDPSSAAKELLPAMRTTDIFSVANRLDNAQYMVNKSASSLAGSVERALTRIDTKEQFDALKPLSKRDYLRMVVEKKVQADRKLLAVDDPSIAKLREEEGFMFREAIRASQYRMPFFTPYPPEVEAVSRHGELFGYAIIYRTEQRPIYRFYDADQNQLPIY